MAFKFEIRHALMSGFLPRPYFDSLVFTNSTSLRCSNIIGQTHESALNWPRLCKLWETLVRVCFSRMKIRWLMKLTPEKSCVGCEVGLEPLKLWADGVWTFWIAYSVRPGGNASQMGKMSTKPEFISLWIVMNCHINQYKVRNINQASWLTWGFVKVRWKAKMGGCCRGRVLHAGDDMGAFFIVDNLVTRQLPWEWHVNMAHVIPTSKIQDSLDGKKTLNFVLDEFPVWFRSFSFHSARLWSSRNMIRLRPWTRDRSLHLWIPSYRHTKLDCEMRPGTIWDLGCGSRGNWYTMMAYGYAWNITKISI